MKIKIVIISAIINIMGLALTIEGFNSNSLILLFIGGITYTFGLLSLIDKKIDDAISQYQKKRE